MIRLMSHESIHRRNLPHWFMPGAAHFVTFRLAGTLPAMVLADLKSRTKQLLEKRPSSDTSRYEHRLRVHKQVFAEFDRYLDNNREIDWLQAPSVAGMVRQSLYHLHGSKYGLLAYSIMPNHVHVLLMPIAESEIDSVRELPCGESEDSESPLSSIMHSLKSFTAHEANKLLRRRGPFWQHESYDHWVRDDDELERIVSYINANAVNAGLVRRPHDWFWCSAHDRYLVDGDSSGWLKIANASNQVAFTEKGTSEDAYATN
jgi:putative transposase